MIKKPRFIWFLKSLRLRMIILIILATLIPGIVMFIGINYSYESRALSIRTSEVQSQAQMIANQIATSNIFSYGSSISDSLETQMTTIGNLYNGRLMIVDDTYKIIYDTYNIDDNRFIISEEVISSFSGATNTLKSIDGAYHYLEMTVPITDPSDKEANIKGVLIVSVSTDNTYLTKTFLNQVSLYILIISATLVIFIGILLVIASLKPFEKMSGKIAEIKNGYGDDQLSITEYSETEDICRQFNSLVSSMKVMDESRQEFVSNVSHELKTPLTSMKVLADSINSMPEAPVEMYQEFMADITNEIDRETKIINDLLSLVKMDKSAADLNITTVNINELVESILKRLQPIADKAQVELVLESFRPITADIDEVKMTLAITNLVENGIKYNKTEGERWVHVSLNADHQFFYIKVEDSGIGIPADSIDNIYERFYRVDKSHSREIGGTGLGLAITRNAILMHKGAIKVYSEFGVGTTFDVRIPLTYIV